MDTAAPVRRRSSIARRLAISVLGLATPIALGACATEGGVASNVVVSDAWARNDPMTAGEGAVYLLITSESDDAIVGAAVDVSIAADAELARTTDDGSTTGGLDRIDLPAGETVTLRPGGFHLRLLGIPTPLTGGETVDVTLRLASGGSLAFPVQVREDGE